MKSALAQVAQTVGAEPGRQVTARPSPCPMAHWPHGVQKVEADAQTQAPTCRRHPTHVTELPGLTMEVPFTDNSDLAFRRYTRGTTV